MKILFSHFMHASNKGISTYIYHPRGAINMGKVAYRPYWAILNNLNELSITKRE